MLNFFWRIGVFLFFYSQTLFALDAPISYSYVPKFVYKNEVFPVTIAIKHFNPKESIHFEFDPLSLMQPLEFKPVVTLNKDEAFFTFYFKAKYDLQSLTIPSLTIWNRDFSYLLNEQTILVKKTPKTPQNYAGVMAANFLITLVRVNPYDSSNSLVELHIKAVQANLENMHINSVKEDGIEALKRNGASVKAIYYFVVPASVKKIAFSYYNLLQKKFLTKEINIAFYKNRLEFNTITPKELSFEKVKKYTLFFFIILFALMFYYTRDKVYLFILLLSTIIFVLFFLPKKRICINEGASLYVLPTQKSSVSLQITQKITKTVLKKYQNFYKIEYHGITGWVKDEDLCKN